MNDFYYKKLDAYKLSKELVIYVYALLRKFPDYELYALSSQIRRAAISVPSNIAEGVGRMAIKERIHFLEIAYGSLTELLCQLEIANYLNYITESDYQTAEDKARKAAMVISGLRKSFLQKINECNK